MSDFKAAINSRFARTADILPFEHRPRRRKRVLYAGLIVYANGESSLDCIIRDLTDIGAHISVPRNTSFPSRFYLINLHDRLAHEAKVIWNIGVDAGVTYEKTFRLAEITDPSLLFLTRMEPVRSAR